MNGSGVGPFAPGGYARWGTRADAKRLRRRWLRSGQTGVEDVEREVGDVVTVMDKCGVWGPKKVARSRLRLANLPAR